MLERKKRKKRKKKKKRRKKRKKRKKRSLTGYYHTYNSRVWSILYQQTNVSSFLQTQHLVQHSLFHSHLGAEAVGSLLHLRCRPLCRHPSLVSSFSVPGARGARGGPASSAAAAADDDDGHHHVLVAVEHACVTSLSHRHQRRHNHYHSLQCHRWSPPAPPSFVHDQGAAFPPLQLPQHRRPLRKTWTC